MIMCRALQLSAACNQRHGAFDVREGAFDVREGAFAGLREIASDELVASGIVLKDNGAWYVGAERFVYGVHVVTEVVKRRRV